METADIHRQAGRGISIAAVARKDLTDLYLMLYPAVRNEKPASMLERAFGALSGRGAAVVKFDVFGPPKALSECAGRLSRKYGDILPWPVTLAGTGQADGLAGIQIHAVTGVAVETIFLYGKPVARVYEDRYARYCALGGVRPRRLSDPRKAQALSVFAVMEKALRLSGMGMPDIVRTWFHIEDILSWYEDFNSARNKFFGERNMSGKFSPASTGIGGENPDHAALIAGALAVKAKAEQRELTVFRGLPSPMQCPAPEYGSSFSRAVELGTPECRRLFISGTASIGAGGKTIHQRDVKGQISFTMKVVGALLASRGMDFSDVTRTIAYFRHSADFGALREFLGNTANSGLCPVLTQNIICRDDLLFEIEVDAALQRGEMRPKGPAVRGPLCP